MADVRAADPKNRRNMINSRKRYGKERMELEQGLRAAGAAGGTTAEATAPDAPDPAPESDPVRHPATEEWDDLLRILSAQYRLLPVQADLLKQMTVRLSGEERERLETLTSEMTAIRRLLEQTVRTRGRHSLLELRPPRFPQLSPVWLIPPAALFGLAVVWYSGAALWRGLAALLP